MAQIEATYQGIEQRFQASLGQGRIETDPYLRGDIADNRRGLTLIARPEDIRVNALQSTLGGLVAELGDQYLQPAEDLHTTVLSIIPGTPNYPPPTEVVSKCITCVAKAIAKCGEGFEIDYRGLIASSDALLVKGYPHGDALQQLRAEILSELAASGLGDYFERRYPMVAAHMTVARFTRQPQNLTVLADGLKALGQQSFGTSSVTKVELVENDWYMRTQTLRLEASYPLRAISKS